MYIFYYNCHIYHFQERVDKLSESCRRYKNQIRLLVNKLKEAGIEDVQDILEGNGTVYIYFLNIYRL